MDRTTQEFRLENVRALVETFFEGITENQWRLMILGTPDNNTQIQLVELILGIIRTVSDTLLTTIEKQNRPDSKRRALDTLNDMLPNSFSQALGIPDQANNSSLKSLSDLIQTEITENIDAALSNRLKNAQTALNQHIVPPSRLNIMVTRASEILKNFATMLKRLFCSSACKREVNQPTIRETYGLSLRLEQPETLEDSGWTEYQEDIGETEYQEYSGGTEIQWDSGETENRVDSGEAENQEYSRETETVEDSGQTEYQEDVGETEYQEYSGDNQDDSEETENQGNSGEAENQRSSGETEDWEGSGEKEDQDDLWVKEYQVDSGKSDTQEVSGQAETLEHSSEDSFIQRTSESLQEQIRRELRELVLPILDNFSDSEYDKIQSESSLELQNLANEIASSIYFGVEKEQSLIEGRFRIKQFLAKCLSKAWLIRLCEKIRRKHIQESNQCGDSPAESFLDTVNFWLQIENQGAEGEDSLISWFNISSNNALIFTKELSDLIYRHLTSNAFSKTEMRLLGELDVPECHNEMYADILGKVWIFVVLMNWWLNSQGQIITERVEIPLRMPLTAPGSSERDVVRMEKNRCCVKFFVEKIVAHVLFDVKMMPDNKHDIIKYLFENVCAKVQGENFYVTPDIFKGLDKRINRVLYKRLGTPEMVLFSINSKDPIIEECIITIIKERLMKPPKKPSSIRRFFSRTKSSPRS